MKCIINNLLFFLKMVLIINIVIWLEHNNSNMAKHVV